MTQYTVRPLTPWTVQLQVPLRRCGSFSFTISQSSSVNTHSGKRLKTPRIIQTCLHHLLNFLRAKCGLKRLLPRWSRCRGFSNNTGELYGVVDREAFNRELVLIASAALWRSEFWRVQSSIFKTSCQNSTLRSRQMH